MESLEAVVQTGLCIWETGRRRG